MPKTRTSLRRDAIAIFRASLAAADAGNAVRNHVALTRNHLTAGTVRLALRDFDRIFLVGAGKASVAMAAALDELLGPRLSSGLVVTKHGHITSRLRRIEVREAGHPIPDEAGFAASIAIRKLLAQLNARDLLLVAVSGGASSLLVAPVEPVTLAEKQNVTDLLLRAGATINELNAVRKHLSMIKGGRLAALAFPATVLTFLLSDVIGDPLDVIGSGPTAPDPTTFQDALAVLEKFRLLRKVPRSVRAVLERGAERELPETPKPGDPLFDSVHNVIVGSNRIALDAARRKAKELGYRTLILSSSMQGEAREVARVHAQILREAISSGQPLPPPVCILSGGETTVTVKGSGKGGRNQEFALAAALDLAGLPNALVLSGGTDGTDGPTDAAGAVTTGETIDEARRRGLDPRSHLERNDSYAFFDALGDLVKTGPTGTNVMDIHVLLAR